MDIRIEHIFREEMSGDNSFKEKENALSLMFGGIKYSQLEMRDTWQNGIRRGIEIGLRKASLDGQIIELNSNTDNERHKEFLKRFYALAEEFNCAIQYHPEHGMVVVDLQTNKA